MRKNTKLVLFLAIFIICIVIVLFLISISKKKETNNEKTLSFICSYTADIDEREKLEILLENYELYTNNQVETSITYTGHPLESLLYTLNKGKTTDNSLAILSSADTFTLIDNNLISPVDSAIMSTYGYSYFDKIPKDVIYNSVYNNKIWSIPYKTDKLRLVYHKDIQNSLDINSKEHTVELQSILNYLQSNANQSSKYKYNFAFPIRLSAIETLIPPSTPYPRKAASYTLDTKTINEGLLLFTRLLKNSIIPMQKLSESDVYNICKFGDAPIALLSDSYFNLLMSQTSDYSSCNIINNGNPAGVLSTLSIFKLSKPENHNQNEADKFLRWYVKGLSFNKFKFDGIPKISVYKNSRVNLAAEQIMVSIIEKLVNEGNISDKYVKNLIFNADKNIQNMFEQYLK